MPCRAVPCMSRLSLVGRQTHLPSSRSLWSPKGGGWARVSQTPRQRFTCAQLAFLPGMMLLSSHGIDDRMDENRACLIQEDVGRFIHYVCYVDARFHFLPPDRAMGGTLTPSITFSIPYPAFPLGGICLKLLFCSLHTVHSFIDGHWDH